MTGLEGCEHAKDRVVTSMGGVSGWCAIILCFQLSLDFLTFMYVKIISQIKYLALNATL
jgi:hypothetical protein